MLYVKLAVRNIQRSIKEYAVFLLTMTVCITLTYAFNACAYSSIIVEVTQRAENFSIAITMVSILMVFVISWLIFYITKFIIRQRSKEFGMYMLMGMKRRQISFMFLFEQFGFGLVSFVLGCLFGTILYRILLEVIIQLYGVSFAISFEISKKGLAITAIYFICIYILELVREWWILKKFTIHELLYENKKNQVVHTSRWRNVVSCGLALIFLTTGFSMMYFFSHEIKQSNVNLQLFFAACVILVFSIYFVFISLSTAFTTFINRNLKIKYSHHHLFLYGVINSRIKSNRFVLASLCVMTILTMSFVCTAMKFKEVNDYSNEHYLPFPLMYESNSKMNVEPIQTYMKEHHIQYDEHIFQLYDNILFQPNLAEGLVNTHAYYKNLQNTFIKESDYLALRKMKNLSIPEKLKQNEVALCVSNDVVDDIKEYVTTASLTYQNEELHLTYIQSEEIGQSSYDVYYIILPDLYFEGQNMKQYMYYLETDDVLTAAIADEIEVFDKVVMNESNQENTFVLTRIEGAWERENMNSFIIIGFSLFYSAIIFSCIAATILAIQQLSTIKEQRYQYAILNQIGCSKKELKYLLFKQILIYFLIPFIIPMFYVIPVLSTISTIFEVAYITGSIWIYFLIALGFYMLLYGAYFILTFTISKRSILK